MKTILTGIPLKKSFTPDRIEAGCDEAGRGCLAGPVFAAAVILPKNFSNDSLNDSKKMNHRQRIDIRPLIQQEALAWAVASASPEEIDDINILHASFLAMHRALDSLGIIPQLLLIDGNRFDAYRNIPHRCIVKGDATYMSVAAASILAKTCRDEYMESLHNEFPMYDWKSNKGYPSVRHAQAILECGPSIHHRKSFHFKGQLRLTL